MSKQAVRVTHDADGRGQQRRSRPIEHVFIAGASHLITELREVGFYDLAAGTLVEARRRALYLKDIIENKDGYRALYFPNGEPIRRESHLQVM
jgi:hypothetical protein